MRSEAELLELVESFREPFTATVAKHDREESFPAENFELLRQNHLLALTAPVDLGGEGLWAGDRFGTYYRLLATMAAFDCNTSQLLQVHSHALGILCATATPAQHDTYVKDIVANGKVLASVGSESSPAKTSDGLYVQELQPQDDGSWVLTCEKHFASVAAGADYLLIWLAVPGDAPYEQRTVCVLVPSDAPEVELVDEWDVMGMRATVSWGVKVTDLHLPADAVFGAPGYWVKDEVRTFSLGFAANHVGQAQGILDFCLAWVRKRPHLQHSDLMMVRLGSSASQLAMLRAGLDVAAAEWERGEDPDLAELKSLQVLHVAKKVLLHVSQEAFDICGARAVFRSLPLEQAYRDARVFTLHTRDEHLTASVGRGLLNGDFSGKGYIDGATVPRVGK
ncbi:acyl-CoA dehydrogenase family protein [Nocardioides sp. GY 10127]|uniref:acyl-CoA dehydrogenase family protein n=1 Tax=Nocardioides sp. GY 10127 TaxID=2569762 RepID=UPI0010A8A272|nr:acyl-CoA dehydrogenase family protein [Nocardioides sp. GY 10127]TIC85695.1 acyl-CoA dehydrogenase [Nocardioides sp. GY 10127]